MAPRPIGTTAPSIPTQAGLCHPENPNLVNEIIVSSCQDGIDGWRFSFSGPGILGWLGSMGFGWEKMYHQNKTLENLERVQKRATKMIRALEATS